MEKQGISIRVSDDRMSAFLLAEPPEDGVIRTEEELLAALQEAGVTRGIEKETLRNLIAENRYYEEFTVANGKQAVNGRDGAYTFYFRTEMPTKPTILPDGSVDYKNMDLFEPVYEGQLVAEYTGATAGSFGYTVTGQLLLPKKGKDLPPLKGKGFAVSEDKKKYTSLMDGRIEYRPGELQIASFFVVSGDVDMTRGNIRFNGDVEIRGDVMSGMLVEASGSLLVSGHVGAATLSAGGDIVLREGMQGGGGGSLSAGGNIEGKFFENAEITCKGNFTANYLLNCMTTVDGSVKITGKRGAIIGGLTRAVRGVNVVTLGNTAEILTVIDAGVNSELSKRYNELKRHLNKVDAELKIFTEGKQKLEASPAQMQDKNAQIYSKVKQAISMKEQERELYMKEYRKLTEIIFETAGTTVAATGTVYGGVKVIIDMEELFLRECVKNVSFKKRDDHVVIFQN